MKNSFVIFSFFISLITSAQYENSIGVRGGLRGLGISYKHFLAPKLFLVSDLVGTSSQELLGAELIASVNVRNKIHTSKLQSKALTWSYGGGFHGGYYQSPTNTNNESSIILGPDLRIGSEYIFNSTWCLGIDISGMYNVMPFEKVAGMDNKFSQIIGAGLFVRYIIR